eukprot:XP_001694576.1 predicted protein [Chlamydomonas reinhardtii]
MCSGSVEARYTIVCERLQTEREAAAGRDNLHEDLAYWRHQAPLKANATLQLHQKLAQPQYTAIFKPNTAAVAQGQIAGAGLSLFRTMHVATALPATPALLRCPAHLILQLHF